MTKEDIQEFKLLFSKYCRQEINQGKCEADTCSFCPVNKAYDEIFKDTEDSEMEDEE